MQAPLGQTVYLPVGGIRKLSKMLDSIFKGHRASSDSLAIHWLGHASAADRNVGVQRKIAGGCPDQNFVCSTQRSPAMRRSCVDGKRMFLECQAHRFRFTWF